MSELTQTEEKVYRLLIGYPHLIHIKCTKELIWRYWQEENAITDEVWLHVDSFKGVTSPETITRVARKLKNKLKLETEEQIEYRYRQVNKYEDYSRKPLNN